MLLAHPAVGSAGPVLFWCYLDGFVATRDGPIIRYIDLVVYCCLHTMHLSPMQERQVELITNEPAQLEGHNWAGRQTLGCFGKGFDSGHAVLVGRVS